MGHEGFQVNRTHYTSSFLQASPVYIRIHGLGNTCLIDKLMSLQTGRKPKEDNFLEQQLLKPLETKTAFKHKNRTPAQQMRAMATTPL